MIHFLETSVCVLTFIVSVHPGPISILELPASLSVASKYFGLPILSLLRGRKEILLGQR